MPSISITVTGLPEAERRLASAASPSGILASALYDVAQKIMARSQAIVPWERGILASSAQVNHPVPTGTGAFVTFGYGGAASDYAWIQHEGFFRHAAGRQRKYLETPMREARGDFDRELSRAIGRALRGGTTGRL